MFQYRRPPDVDRRTRLGFLPFFPISFILGVASAFAADFALDITLANDVVPGFLGPVEANTTLNLLA